jgi:hypothetical protein
MSAEHERVKDPLPPRPPRPTPKAEDPVDNECLLCGAPGGHPYCNDACRDADEDDTED